MLTTSARLALIALRLYGCCGLRYCPAHNPAKGLTQFTRLVSLPGYVWLIGGGSGVFAVWWAKYIADLFGHAAHHLFGVRVFNDLATRP